MPTVLRREPYRFFILFSDGDEPKHVHVERDRCSFTFGSEATWVVAHQTLEAIPDSFGEHGRHCAHRKREAGRLPLLIEHKSDQALLICQASGCEEWTKSSRLLVVVAGAQPQGLGTLRNESDHQKNLSASPIPFNATPVVGPKDTISAPASRLGCTVSIGSKPISDLDLGGGLSCLVRLPAIHRTA